VFSQGDLQPATYTISVADLEGFKKPENQEVVVEEDTQNSVTITYLEKPALEISRTFSENTPEAIALASAEIESNGYTSSQVKEIYGWDLETDTIDIPLTNGVVINMGILGYNHDVLSSDHVSKVGITLGMTHCLPTSYKMYSSDKTGGGYATSDMKTTILPSYKELLPQAWQDVIKLVDKKSANGGYSSSVATTSSEDLFLLSEIEVFGTTINAKDGANEGSVYEYWNGKTDTDRIKKYDADNDGVPDTDAKRWSLRSVFSDNQSCYVNSKGASVSSYANNPSWVSFAFCV
jgi:hypothetical protein